MSDDITTTRALLRMLDKSPYGDLYIRQDGYELFLSRHGGGGNPMRQAVGQAAQPAAVPAPAPATLLDVTAPHVATLLSALPVGTAVTAGKTALARLGLLDEVIEITAGQDGTIAELVQEPGALLDHGAAILRLAPA